MLIDIMLLIAAQYIACAVVLWAFRDAQGG